MIFYTRLPVQLRITFKIGDVPACLIKQCEALQAGWNVGEENRTKGVPALSARPTVVFRIPEGANSARSANRVLYDVCAALIILM